MRKLILVSVILVLIAAIAVPLAVWAGGNDQGYKKVSIIGTSIESWEDAAKEAVEAASQTFQDLTIAEVKELDVQIQDGKILYYRTKLTLLVPLGE